MTRSVSNRDFTRTQLGAAGSVPKRYVFGDLMGTARREYLDHVPFWNAQDLERKLEGFRVYFNRHRVHSALGGDSLSEIDENVPRKPAKLADFRWQSHCRGLYELPTAA